MMTLLLHGQIRIVNTKSTKEFHFHTITRIEKVDLYELYCKQ